MKEVWIPGLTLHKFCRFFPSFSPLFNDRFEKLYQPTSRCLDILMLHSFECLIYCIQKRTTLSVCGYSNENHFGVLQCLLSNIFASAMLF